MRKTEDVAYEDLDETHRWCVDVMNESLADVCAIGTAYDAPVLLYRFVLHPHDGEGFLVVAIPDGPYLAVTPLGPLARKVLFAGLREQEVNGVAWAGKWADTVRWHPVVDMLLTRVGDGVYQTQVAKEEEA